MLRWPRDCALWSARTCPRYGKRRHVAALQKIAFESVWNFSEDALRTAHATALDAVASAVLSGELDSKPEQECLVAANVPQRFLIRAREQIDHAARANRAAVTELALQDQTSPGGRMLL